MIFSTLYKKAGWPILLALGLAVSTAACSSESPSSSSSDPGDIDEPGSTKGQLTAYVATFDDATTETNYYLRVASGEELKLTLHQPITADPGTVLRVWGQPTQDGIDVTSLRVVAPPASAIGSSASALIGGAPLADRNFCVVLINLNGTALTVTAQAAATQFFDGPTSINAYYRENSYGVQGVDGAVYGPFDYTMAACANADTNNMATAMRTQVMMANGGTAPSCTQYAYIFSRTNICAFGGLGALGSPTMPARDTWYNGSISCVVTVQEPGHNFGMQHSSSMQCTAPAIFADDPNTCTHSEYGDIFDPMGGGCRHMNVWQKEYQQWFGGCNSVKVTSTGDFNLSPTELPCDGPQALQIPFATPRPFTRPAAGGGGGGTDTLTSYYLEYRTSVGTFDGGNGSPFATPMVLLHVGADYKTLTTGTRARNTGVHTWLLDMHPTAGQAANQQFRDAGFKVGETFTDPLGNIAITVSAMDATKATVHVEITNGTGGPVCLDGTPYVAGATMCGPPATSAGDGGGTIIVPPAPDAGSTPVGGTGGARVDAGREAGAVTTPEAGASGATGSGGATPGSGGAAGTGGATPGTGGGGGAGGGMGTAGDVGVGGTGSPGTAGDGPGQAGSNASTPGVPPGAVQGGCSCRVGANSTSRGGSDVAGGLALLFGLAGTRLRRRRSSSSARA